MLGQEPRQRDGLSGAVEAFEQSLEVNPHSAAAHFELGWLYDEKESDPAAAIYHYQQYLRLNPNAGNADIINQRIESLQTATGGRRAAVAEHARRAAANQTAARTKPAIAGRGRQMARVLRKPDGGDKINLPRPPIRWRRNPPPSQVPHHRTIMPPPGRTVQARTTRCIRPRQIKPRTHTVVAGETAVRIARKYGVSLDALLAANPGLNPADARRPDPEPAAAVNAA